MQLFIAILGILLIGLRRGYFGLRPIRKFYRKQSIPSLDQFYDAWNPTNSYYHNIKLPESVQKSMKTRTFFFYQYLPLRRGSLIPSAFTALKSKKSWARCWLKVASIISYPLLSLSTSILLYLFLSLYRYTKYCLLLNIVCFQKCYFVLVSAMLLKKENAKYFVPIFFSWLVAISQDKNYQKN